MRRPTDDQFETARCWLACNEGDGGEREACFAVARWLEHQQHEKMLKDAARKAGVTVACLRRSLKARADRCGT